MAHATIAAMLLDRLGDSHPGVRTRARTWTWDDTVRESAARGALATSLRVDGPFHIGVLLPNTAEYLFWLGGAALSGAVIAGVNPTRRGAELEAEIRYVDCQLIVTDSAGMEFLRDLDLGLAADRFLLVDSPGYPGRVDAHRAAPPAADPAVDESSLFLLLSTPERPDDSDNLLVRGFGTEASPEDRAEFARRFGAELFEGYGSSEGAGSVRPDPDAPAGALGRPAHADIAVVDPDTRRECARARLDRHGRVLNPDEAVGEMVDKGGARRFEGYYKNEAAVAERIRHGWYWTGDLGYVDEDGYIYFAGRRGDWIRVDGENISALTIERILRRHPKIVAAAVYAVPDPRSGDQVMAALEVAEFSDFDPAGFARFLGEQDDLGTKSAPRFVRVSTRLPVTGSNKVLKRELRERLWRGDEPVYRRVGREAEYVAMTAAGRDALEREFHTHGRARFLPGADSLGEQRQDLRHDLPGHVVGGGGDLDDRDPRDERGAAGG